MNLLTTFDSTKESLLTLLTSINNGKIQLPDFQRGWVWDFAQIFDCSDWRSGYHEFWDYDKEKIKLFDKFEKEIIERFKQYQVPLIRLKKETPKDAVCHVFEKVNTGGVPLTVFELLTATYAAEDFQMRQDWDKREKELKKQQVLDTIQNTDFLQALTLLVSLEGWFAAKKAEIKKLPSISCRRKDILRLTLGEYTNWAEQLTEGFKEAARLLRSQKIFTTRDLPYRSQLIPLAAILTWLNSRARNDGVRTKLARWYWCGVFGELYGSSGETFFAKDFVGLLNWINGHMEPDTIPAIVNANFAPSRLFNLRNRNSAAYKGLYALLMRDDCLDFRTGEAIDVQMYFDDKIDIHHIFPKEWCKQKKIDPKLYDSIINKTPLSAKTNRMIGSNAPSVYLARIQKNAGISESRMDEILRSHLIDPVALRVDDFDTFFQARKEALLDRIEKAMDKPIPRDVAEPAEYEDETES